MTHEHSIPTPPSRHHLGPQGLGEQAAAILGPSDAASEGLGGMEAQDRLRQWAAQAECLIAEFDWLRHQLVSAATAEHEVRYRAADHRAVKRTWPGTFGFVPKRSGAAWTPQAASPAEYLRRQRLQNDLFQDDIRLEGVMVSDGPSMIIGQPAGGISFVISQPWIEAVDAAQPHPSESEISAFMQKMGFTPLIGSLFGWINESEGVVVLDAKPDNFVLTPAGILPIDLLIADLDPASQ